MHTTCFGMYWHKERKVYQLITNALPLRYKFTLHRSPSRYWSWNPWWFLLKLKPCEAWSVKGVRRGTVSKWDLARFGCFPSSGPEGVATRGTCASGPVTHSLQQVLLGRQWKAFRTIVLAHVSCQLAVTRFGFVMNWPASPVETHSASETTPCSKCIPTLGTVSQAQSILQVPFYPLSSATDY